jgi:hypothetical protein
MTARFTRNVGGFSVRIGLPRRIKDDVNGRKRGRVRRRLVVRFYRRLAVRYTAWEKLRFTPAAR